MLKAKILIADNDKFALDTCESYLRSKGYDVHSALSPSRVTEILDEENIHLAVLDIRLIDDTQEDDFSGIWIAQQPDYAARTAGNQAFGHRDPRPGRDRSICPSP